VPIKTDNANLVGTHAFESAGLGKAPFRCVGFTRSVYQAHPDAPQQPGSSCDYCGTGIMDVALIRSVDGKTFKVGCNCVEKVGDQGLIKAYKMTPEYRAFKREQAATRDQKIKTEWPTFVEANRDALSAVTVDGYYGREAWYSLALRTFPRCGASGRARYMASAKRIVKTGKL
jgi:hypothetical protein